MNADRSQRTFRRKEIQKKRMSMNIDGLISEISDPEHTGSAVETVNKNTSFTQRVRPLKNTNLYSSARKAGKREEIDEHARKWSSISEGLEQNYSVDVQKVEYVEQVRQGQDSLNMSNYKVLFCNPTMTYLFLGFLLEAGTPRELLFGLLVESVRSTKMKKPRKDLPVLFYQIYSLFVDEQSPLCIPALSLFRDSIVNGMNSAENDILIRSAFDSAFVENISSLAKQFLAFTQHKSDIVAKYLGKDSTLSLMDSPEDFTAVIGGHLERISNLYKLPLEFDPTHVVEIGLVVAFQTLFSLNGFKSPHVSDVFFTDKKVNYKTLKKRSMGTKSSHAMIDVCLSRPTTCGVCRRIVWGSLPQGLECSSCLLVTHTFCNLTSLCLKRKQSSVMTLKNLKSSKQKLRKQTTIAESVQTASDKSLSRTISHSDSISILEEEFDATNYAGIMFDSDLDYQSDLPTLESVYGQAEYKALSANSRKLHQVLNEFIHTERSHLRILKTMNLIFYKPMADREMAKLIFSSITQLIEYHSLLVDSFKERRRNKTVSDKFADSLTPLFNDSVAEGFAEACCAFCSDQKYVLTVLGETLRTNSEFAHFIAEGEKCKFCRDLKLKDLLISQMQRLTRYLMLIEQIIKFSKVDAEETDKLTRIKNYARGYLTKVNEYAAVRENHHYLAKLIAFVEVKPEIGLIPRPYELFDVADKPLLHKGEVGIKMNKKYNECLLLLFDTDLVILFKSDQSRYVLRSFVDKATTTVSAQQISPIIALTKDIVIRLLAADKKCFLVLHQKKLQLITFYTNSSTTAKTWVNVMTSALNARLKKITPSTPVSKEKLPLADTGGGKHATIKLEDPKPADASPTLRRLKKINSMYQRTSILCAQKSNVAPLFDVLVSRFNSILCDIKSIDKNNEPSGYLCMSEDQLTNLQHIVQTLEIMNEANHVCESNTRTCKDMQISSGCQDLEVVDISRDSSSVCLDLLGDETAEFTPDSMDLMRVPDDVFKRSTSGQSLDADVPTIPNSLAVLSDSHSDLEDPKMAAVKLSDEENYNIPDITVVSSDSHSDLADGKMTESANPDEDEDSPDILILSPDNASDVRVTGPSAKPSDADYENNPDILPVSSDTHSDLADANMTESTNPDEDSPEILILSMDNASDVRVTGPSTKPSDTCDENNPDILPVSSDTHSDLEDVNMAPSPAKYSDADMVPENAFNDTLKPSDLVEDGFPTSESSAKPSCERSDIYG